MTLRRTRAAGRHLVGGSARRPLTDVMRATSSLTCAHVGGFRSRCVLPAMRLVAAEFSSVINNLSPVALRIDHLRPCTSTWAARFSAMAISRIQKTIPLPHPISRCRRLRPRPSGMMVAQRSVAIAQPPRQQGLGDIFNALVTLAKAFVSNICFPISSCCFPIPPFCFFKFI